MIVRPGETLGVAIGLDRAHRGSVEAVTCREADDGVVVEVHPADGADTAVEVWSADERKALLVDVLERPVEVTGPIVVKLWISSSARDTDFTAKLIDVAPPNADYPDGYHMNLVDSVIRTRFRNGWEQEQFMEPDQVYRRLVAGLPGSPMPQNGYLHGPDGWHLVHLVRSLSSDEQRAVVEMKMFRIVARRIRQVPAHPDSGVWRQADPVNLHLMPLWWRAERPEVLSVKAVHDGSEIAFLLSWADATHDHTAMRPQDFRDAAALEFSLQPDPPFFAMGQNGAPVNIWVQRDDLAAQGELAELEQRLAQARHETGRVEERITMMEKSEERSRALSRQETILARIDEAAEQWAVITLCRALLDETRKIYETERQPEVLRQASSFITVMTEGRYTRVIAPLDGGEIQLERADGADRRGDLGSRDRGTFMAGSRRVRHEHRREGHDRRRQDHGTDGRRLVHDSGNACGSEGGDGRRLGRRVLLPLPRRDLFDRWSTDERPAAAGAVSVSHAEGLRVSRGGPVAGPPEGGRSRQDASARRDESCAVDAQWGPHVDLRPAAGG